MAIGALGRVTARVLRVVALDIKQEHVHVKTQYLQMAVQYVQEQIEKNGLVWCSGVLFQVCNHK